MSECTHDCSSCSENCSSRENKIQKLEPAAGVKVKHLIGVVSGKGGVGKSIVTSTLAVAMMKKGYKTAILDADITGPSIPKAFGTSGPVYQNEEGKIEPVVSEAGIKMMSLNLMVEDETQPVAWRGPVIAGVVSQYWTDVSWGEVDFMFVDMPPGTGDVPLTVFQSLPLEGIVVVTTPQDLAAMIVEKAIHLAELLSIPVLGVIENMSYVVCPFCNERIYMFGQSHAKKITDDFQIPLLCELPVDPALAALVDAGKIEELDTKYVDILLENFPFDRLAK